MPKPTTILIVEDEELAAEKLQRQLNDTPFNLEVVKITESIKSTVEFLKENTLDLILLDIHLADGLSFKIFDQIEVSTPIIFTTAYDEFALNAFKLYSIDYLLKPIVQNDLEAALQKYFKMFESKSSNDKLEQLMTAFGIQKDKQLKHLLISKTDTFFTLPINEVSYFFADGKYCFAVTHENEQHLVDKTLETLSSEIDEGTFFRANRKFLINRVGIDKITQFSKSKLKVILKCDGNVDITVSAERSKLFKDWLVY